jgi:hypothetical protein
MINQQLHINRLKRQLYHFNDIKFLGVNIGADGVFFIL